MLDRLVRNLPREQDRKAFVGWRPGDALPDEGAGDGSTDGADASAGEADTGSAAALATSAPGA